jgi:DNA-binding MarR family transcriptional regulator
MKNRLRFNEEPKERIDFPVENIDNNSWRIIKAIGCGAGLSTSQIYKALKMSGSTFNEAVQKLRNTGLIDCKEIKSRNAKAYYYFLTETGERMFESRFNTDSKNVKIDKENVLAIFKTNGWNCEQLNEKEFALSNNSNKINLIFVTTTDRKAIFKDLKDGYYYMAATEEIGNIIVQQAARKAKNSRIAILLAIADEFAKNYGFQRLVL